jgi:multicomponent Na+:H+ antiporter subunit F
MEDLDGFLLWAVFISLAIISLAILGAFVRLIRGPSLPDRVIAIDLVAYLTMGFLATYSVLIQEETYIDVALVLGLLAFLGTVAFARYIERVHAEEETTEL